MNIKRDDLVVVISGNHKGQGPAKVLAITSGKKRLEVQGIGDVLRHVKRGHPKSPQGGRVQVPSTIEVSKVSLYCEKCARGVRTGVVVVDGRKLRCCVRCKSSF